MIDIGLLS